MLESLYVKIDCFDGDLYPSLSKTMPQDQSCIELNFYFNDSIIELAADTYEIDGKVISDPQHMVQKVYWDEFELDNMKHTKCFWMFVRALHIITMTKHTFCDKTGTTTSDQPQIIHTGLSTKEKDSSFQIVFYIKEGEQALRYWINNENVCGTCFNLEKVVQEKTTNLVVSITSHAFIFDEFEGYGTSIFNSKYYEYIWEQKNWDFFCSPDFTKSAKGRTCALTCAGEYYAFGDDNIYKGNTSLYESIRFLD